jgi:hypothetical protein
MQTIAGIFEQGPTATAKAVRDDRLRAAGIRPAQGAAPLPEFQPVRPTRPLRFMLSLVFPGLVRAR